MVLFLPPSSSWVITELFFGSPSLLDSRPIFQSNSSFCTVVFPSLGDIHGEDEVKQLKEALIRRQGAQIPPHGLPALLPWAGDVVSLPFQGSKLFKFYLLCIQRCVCMYNCMLEGTRSHYR